MYPPAHRLSARPELLVSETLAATSLHRPLVLCRQHLRVTTQIGPLAQGFRDRVARIHSERRAGFLLESLSIQELTTVIDRARRPWIRAAARPTTSPQRYLEDAEIPRGQSRTGRWAPECLPLLLQTPDQYCPATMPATFAAVRPFSNHWVVLAALGLVAYGLSIDPDTGTGGLPCLWKAILGFECPGCGLSRAGALLLRGRLHDAATKNWRIFPVVGALASKLFDTRSSRW